MMARTIKGATVEHGQERWPTNAEHPPPLVRHVL
jgi:hypothetical protein